VGLSSVFLNLGISNGFAISESNYKKAETKFYSTERIVEERALEEIRKNEQGLVIGAGLKHKRLSLESRYERTNGMSVYLKLNSPINRFYILLGFKI
jgi:hypothetical protein